MSDQPWRAIGTDVGAAEPRTATTSISCIRQGAALYTQLIVHTCTCLQESVVITTRNAWGSPTAAGSVSIDSSVVAASGKGKAASGSPQALQAGSNTGEYLYSIADLQANPGNYK